ncbi:MAG: SDR family NAD(P)-dependent oxidoreductase [Promethearchaeota archaeon]|nr:MAG: SDR family NAD(P)-dependent oxidoreductase [Candidatus Lokiarchaeota archaeon]
MKEFKEKVAVITGAASGIGYGLAKKCIKEGMNVVISDINKEDLRKAEIELKNMHGNVMSVVSDVSKARDVENLAQKAYDQFNDVHLLFNNAGVSPNRTLLWEHTLNDWHWILNVNLWGMIHGVKYFVPKMLEQNTEACIVNTASIMGLMRAGDLYSITKHAVIALSEALMAHLAPKTKLIKVLVLCPSFIRSKILESENIRPEWFENDPSEIIAHPEMEQNRNWMREQNANGLTPEECAEITFEAIKNEEFYVFTNKTVASKNPIKQRFRKILKALD